MITREFNLYLHAGHSIPLVINCNQYDRGEQWLFTLFNADGTQYVPSSGAIVGIKSDNLGIINSGTVDSQGRVVINETQQMTAAVGKAVFELLIDDQTHGTANFVVLVEPKPGDNADLSESDYSLFQQAIDGTSAAAIAEGVADWMDENLTPTSPVVDASLTVQGAAADAKKTGDEISDLKRQIEQSGGGGQPVPVTLVSAMTDTSKIYLYLGEETGYEYGYVYAYVNGVWVSTGLYGRGQNGTNGTDGADGYSPIASVSSTSTGVTISITDKNGTTSASVSNGTATQEQVDSWLDAHPDATTTVADGSISKVKLVSDLQESADAVGLIRKAFSFVPKVIGKGMIVPIEQDKVYYPYTSTNGTEYMRFLDANMTPIKASGDIYKPFNTPNASPYNQDATYAFRIDVNTSARYYFSVSGTTVSTYSYYASPKANSFELASSPVYIQLGIAASSSTPSLTWTIGEYFTYGTASENKVIITPNNENIEGLYEALRSANLVGDKTVSMNKFTDDVNASVDKSAIIATGFNAYRKMLGNGKIEPIQQNAKYYQYTDSTLTEYMRFLDTNKEVIRLADGESFASPFSAPNGGSGYDSADTYAFSIGTHGTSASYYACFSVDGDEVTTYNMATGAVRGSFKLATAPSYIQLGLAQLCMWSVGEYYTYGSAPTDPVNVTPNENLGGFVEFFDSRISNYVAELVGDSDIATQLKCQQIQTVNKLKHAYRFGSWNIYGAGKNKTNWTSVKNLVAKYGIDVIGFQEVKDPLGHNSDGLKFADEVGGWHLSQFSDAVSYDDNARIVAGTSDFVYVSGTDVVYDQQNNYGNRYYSRNEFYLPTWKGKWWSDHLKVSVYDTQLEVGMSTTYTNTRLAQARQLVAAMQADPNPYIVLVGDFNEMTTDQSTFKIIEDAGFTRVFADNSTGTCYRAFYDNIFVNERISVVNDDVVPLTEKGDTISDHNLIMADLVFDYEHIITIKETGEHCTISGENWLDRRVTDPVTITVTPDSGYTVTDINVGQGDNDLTYNNGAIVKNGNTITVYPNLIVGDMWIFVTTAEA